MMQGQYLMIIVSSLAALTFCSGEQTESGLPVEAEIDIEQNLEKLLDKRGFWDKRGFGNKRAFPYKGVPSEAPDPADYPLLYWVLNYPRRPVYYTHIRALLGDSVPATLTSKRGFWDKRGFGDKRSDGKMENYGPLY